jgi:hypothetical protein
VKRVQQAPGVKADVEEKVSSLNVRKQS